MSTQSDDSRQPTAVIAGGGPAGALAAKVLADRGFRVLLYEAYPHPGEDDAPIEKSKAYGISLSNRGQLALKRCGVDPLADLDAAVISEALARHDKSGGASVVSRQNYGGPGSVLIRHRALAASLMRAAEGSGAEIRCGWRLRDVDFGGQQATLVEGTEGENVVTVGYDLLVAADGAHSRTRTLLSNYLNEKGEEFNVRMIEDKMEYQVAIMPRPWKEILLPEKVNAAPLNTCSPETSHSWADTKLGTTALGWPLRKSNDSPTDGFMVIVICPPGLLGKMKSSGLPGYTSALVGLFPDWTTDSRLDLARLLAEEDNIPSSGGTCIWPSALAHSGSGVILVGDAGHGMWPSLGQGCNAALESVSVLADAVEAVDGSVSSGAGCRNIDFSTSSHKDFIEAIAIEYDGLRQDDALAAVDLAYEGVGGTSVRGLLHMPIMFKVQLALFMILNKVTMGLVPMPAFMRILKGDTARYSTLQTSKKVEKCVTYGTLLGIVGFCLSFLF